MRIARFAQNGESHLGFIEGDGIRPFPKAIDLSTVLGSGETRTQMSADAGPLVAIESVTLQTPITAPPQFIGVGLNYRDHAIEAGLELPDSPISFAFHRSAIIGPQQPIEIPSFTNQVDWEAELAIVIGSQGRNISIEDALDHVAGYTIVNDVSARDIQMRESQSTRAKSFDTFKPIGPCITTTDELADPQNLSISLSVNGTEKQRSSTAEMVFTVAQIVSFLSKSTTLLPGAVIATGTPSGVGASRKPPEFLRPGDTVTIEIEGIGSLTNPVVAQDV